ncbi:ABC transporter ATP-binding protein [Terribacillus sp. DMT04]|uniref:ABC transporter ATP-binding protein n=1 Tax=Terribacillus sp. DMT04 TaxID=2850441 RepID=UPI001C2B9831|nr:ABC transporter ATP-binding protein [Terribacillus sp. DMT04]QXE02928.1 ABC transporter ATP-binding protein [Terribacillus sp. DMT04]
MLKLTHIKKSFQGKLVLKDITFRMAQGESIVMLGANGAGKSTLLKIIMKMLREDGGKIEWSLKKPRISYVPQSPSMIGNLTVWQFASYLLALHGRKEKTLEALGKAGLEAQKKEIAENLSTGQMKRLLFQLAVLAKPELLIMDEPTAGMDLEAKRQFYRQLAAMRQTGMSFIVTTHILSEAEQLADRLLYLDGGMIKKDRPIYEIKQDQQTISFSAGREYNLLLSSLGYHYQDGIYRKLTKKAEEEIKVLLNAAVPLKQLEVTSNSLETYVEELEGEETSEHKTVHRRSTWQKRKHTYKKTQLLCGTVFFVSLGHLA